MSKPYVQRWLHENPTVKHWLTEEVTRENTRYDYGYNLMRFCEGVSESPERLVDVRFSEDPKVLAEFRKKHDIPKRRRPDKDGAYVILDLLKKFIRSGTLIDLSPRNFGGEIDVASLSKSKRSGMYNTVRAYFKSEAVSGGLPDENFKITQVTRVGHRSKDFNMEDMVGVEQARRIILAAKEPYRTLFWAGLYGCLGNDELCNINGMWESIRKQLQGSVDPVRLDFEYRKENELPYYTFVPAKVFQPYIDSVEGPFLNAKRGRTGGNSINDDNLIKRWVSARMRSGVDVLAGEHNIRDLWRTYAVKAGLEPSSAEFLMGHSATAIDPNRYNQIYNDPSFVRAQWEKMRKLLDGESEEWRKPVEELRQRLDKTEYERREDLRQANRHFLVALQFSPKQIKRIAEQHGGDLANLTKEEKGKLGEQVKARLGQLKPTTKESKPPLRLRVPKEEVELLQEQGWEKIEVFESGRVLLEWRYATPPPKRPILVPSK